MYSVFSQSLIESWKLYYKVQHRQEVPRDLELKLYDVMQCLIDKNKTNYIPQVLYTHRITTLDYIAEDALYEICTKPEIRKVIEWISKNIITNILKDNFATVRVKIRIAVDMLNKLENKGIISKELNLFYFDNVITNIHNLFWESVSDDLPF